MKRALLTAVAVLVLAGCAGDDEAQTTDTDTTTSPVATTQVRVYWLRDGKVWPVARDVAGPDGVNVALDALLPGPSDEEADLGFTTALPESVTAEGSVANGVARFEISPELSEEALAQVVYTLTQDSDVTSVEIEGRTLTRADFEDFAPAILVESPLAFETVSSPLRARGTANTFEATFSFEIADSGGDVIADDFVTATSGTGTRGTFEFRQPFVVDEDQDGTLTVFELSAKDGSRINVAEIPIRLKE